MGKKRKKAARRNTKPKHRATTATPKNRSKYALMTLSLGVVLIGVGIFYLYQSKPPPKPSVKPVSLKKKNINLRETRQTLPPALFSGRVKRAYQIARDIPAVLDKLYCYCMCKENSGHKNLLTCYVDNHAAT
jgi:hypothetical protein